MAKLSAETKAKIKAAARHPVVWWRGAGLPEEKIRPWEGGIQFLAEALKGFMVGYTNIKDKLYLGMGEGKIPPNWKSVHDVAVVTWDALNDPMIGTYMDRRRFSEKVHRWIMRFNATFSPLFILLQCFSFGMTPLQRIIQWTVVAMFADLMSTANAVSETKIWAGITPHDEQRGIVQLCRTVGNQLSDVFRGIPMILMGFQSVTGLSDYQVMIYGAMLFAPFTIFCRWLPSFAKQRVDFTVKVKGESETEEQAERPPTFRECFAVVKRNRWFMMQLVVNLCKMILPGTDYMFMFRFLLPKMKFRGNEYGGELVWGAKNIIFGFPIFALQPFANVVVGKFKSKITFLRLQELTTVLAHIGMYLAGYQSWARLGINFTIEMLRGMIDLWAPVPRELVKYEMYDYVEWKTGLRSEGMTAAVDGMINKLIRNNVGNVIGNAVQQWTGYKGWDIPVAEQPERFLKTIWPLTHIRPIVGGVIGLIALLWFKYPHDPKEVEADLIERRALAQKLKEEAQLNG